MSMQAKIIGLTGNIGSGKSTIARVFEQKGWPVFDSDLAARFVLNKNTTAFYNTIAAFGEDFLGADGEIDRKKLAAVVFNDPEKTARINAIVHPAVKDIFKRWLSVQESAFVIRESALLFEADIYHESYKNIVVTCPLEERIKRVLLRNNTDRNSVLEREKNQWPEEKKVSSSDFTIENFEKPVLPQVMHIIHQLEHQV